MAVADDGVQEDVGVHGLAQARVRQLVRGGHPPGAALARQVRPAARVAQERVHQRARAVRHDQGGAEPGQQGLRHRHPAQVGHPRADQPVRPGARRERRADEAAEQVVVRPDRVQAPRQAGPHQRVVAEQHRRCVLHPDRRAYSGAGRRTHRILLQVALRGDQSENSALRCHEGESKTNYDGTQGLRQRAGEYVLQPGGPNVRAGRGPGAQQHAHAGLMVAGGRPPLASRHHLWPARRGRLLVACRRRQPDTPDAVPDAVPRTPLPVRLGCEASSAVAPPPPPPPPPPPGAPAHDAVAVLGRLLQTLAVMFPRSAPVQRQH
ncbi:hypothetical protein FOCC_FOCC011515 [Frankliniella occidentalis]|nr:hypothetical protein FOCC_FOCC011515 [Frankliniella occidentalis]